MFPFDRSKALQAKMRPLMIIEPEELLQDPHAGLGGARPTDREALIVDGFDEALDLAIGFGAMRSEQAMLDAGTLTSLLEVGLALRVVGEAPGEDQFVVGQDGLDRVRQASQYLLQEGGGDSSYRVRLMA